MNRDAWFLVSGLLIIGYRACAKACRLRLPTAFPLEPRLCEQGLPWVRRPEALIWIETDDQYHRIHDLLTAVPDIPG